LPDFHKDSVKRPRACGIEILQLHLIVIYLANITTISRPQKLVISLRLDISNPEKKYTLKSLEGEFSGLQLVSYMYVGLKKMEPDRDFGMDLEKEYLAAEKLYKEKN